MNVVFGCRAIDFHSLGVEIGALGVPLAVEQPLGMLVQFMPALAEPVEWCEEGTGIARVDFDRPFVLGTDLPDRVELRVIDRHVAAVPISDA